MVWLQSSTTNEVYVVHETLGISCLLGPIKANSLMPSYQEPHCNILPDAISGLHEFPLLSLDSTTGKVCLWSTIYSVFPTGPLSAFSAVLFSSLSYPDLIRNMLAEFSFPLKCKCLKPFSPPHPTPFICEKNQKGEIAPVPVCSSVSLKAETRRQF